MQNTQYFIEGNLVSCTVFNDAGMAFYATATVENDDMTTAMSSALTQAEKARDEYAPKEAYGE